MTIILLGCFIVLGASSATAKTKPELLKALYSSATKGDSYVSKEITLKSQWKDIRKTFGEPKEKQNEEWGAMVVYNAFSIVLTEYLPDLTDSSGIFEIRIFIGNNNINYKDIIKALGKPNYEKYNDAKQRWQAFYKAGGNSLAFYSDSKGKPMFEAAIFKPSEELTKQFKK